MITEAGNMVVYVAGYPAIMGLRPLCFKDPELARRARMGAEFAEGKKNARAGSRQRIKRQKSLALSRNCGETQESVAAFSRCKSWIFVSPTAGFVGSASMRRKE